LVDKIVVIGPQSSQMAWKDEFILNFGFKRQLKFVSVSDASSTVAKIKKLRYDTADINLLFINYEILPSLSKSNVFAGVIDNRTLLVYDEVHRVKSLNGTRANIAKEIAKYSNYRVVLTGTPIPNGLQDIYNILQILYAEEYDSFFGFTVNELIQANKDSVIRQVINDKIYPFFCRTTKQQLKVPKANPDVIIDIKTNDKEKKLFEIIHKTYNSNSLLLYIRLMQASINPKSVLNKLNTQDYEAFSDDEIYDENNNLILSNFNESNENIYLSESDYDFILNYGLTRKFDVLIDKVQFLVNQKKKVLVWGIFISTIDTIVENLSKKFIKTRSITGSIELSMREQIIRGFINGDIDVLVANPHTIAESVSLHNSCHDAVYFEYSFNLTHLLQSKDRIHRLGLKDNQYTQYYFGMYTDDGLYPPIDYRTYTRLIDKEKIMIESIENENIYYPEEDVNEDLRIIFSSK